MQVRGIYRDFRDNLNDLRVWARDLQLPEELYKTIYYENFPKSEEASSYITELCRKIKSAKKAR